MSCAGTDIAYGSKNKLFALMLLLGGLTRAHSFDRPEDVEGEATGRAIVIANRVCLAWLIFLPASARSLLFFFCANVDSPVSVT